MITHWAILRNLHASSSQALSNIKSIGGQLPGEYFDLRESLRLPYYFPQGRYVHPCPSALLFDLFIPLLCSYMVIHRSGRDHAQSFIWPPEFI